MMNFNELFDTIFPVNGSGVTSTGNLNVPLSIDNSSMLLSDEFHMRYVDHEDIDHRPITREIMSNYLSTLCHRTVTIFHAKVAQKSYGNEKRFFCPPPCVYLSGNGWEINSSESYCSSSFTQFEHIFGTIGLGEPLSIHNNNNNNNNCLSNEIQNLSFEHRNLKYSSAKTLFISDSDKRKYINLNVRLMYKDDIQSNGFIGLFESGKMKVISKPSKKKQSVKNAESVCIQSGTKIALFNRLRSQNVSTRFLHVDENNQFHASSQEWGSFYIHLVDHDRSLDESNEFIVKEGFIQYGATVKLVCSMTNQALPYLIIRRVDKNCILIDSDEPVSQLHKCAFEFKNNSPNVTYLSLVNERIIGISGKGRLDRRSLIEITDSACWTIISTDKVEYTWFEARGPVFHPITPIPIAKHLVIDGGGQTAIIEINGENFTPILSVWFGTTESPHTEFQSPQKIIAEVPSISLIVSNKSSIQQTISTPISFVRRDGVIYLTPLVFMYSPHSTETQQTSITN